MLKVHKTKDGQCMFVSQMEDEHLKNLVHSILRKIITLKNALNMKIKTNKLQEALYGFDSDEIVENASDKIKSCTEFLYPYLAEGALRGFDFSDLMQEAFERNGKEIHFEINEDILMIEEEPF